VIAQQEHLAQVIQAKLGGVVRDIEPIQRGMGHRMLSAQWEQDGSILPLTIRCFSGVRAWDEARNEAGALRELCSEGYPVPDVYGLFDDPGLPDAPFVVLQYLPGETVTREALANPERIQYWIERSSDLLLKLHGIKWEGGYNWIDPLTPLGYAERMITWWGRQAGDMGIDSDPDLRAGFDWLRSHVYIARQAKQQSLVHRDFHSDNLICDGKKIIGVIDWADLKIADPAVDVAWTQMILKTEAPEGVAELFVNSYTRRNPGVRVSLPFWEVFSAVKRIIQIDSIKTDQSAKIGIWAGAGELGRLLSADAAIRAFLHERLTTDEED
jgi:aminoglycoside phosphotransferase (APT) family kinase protein